MLPGYLLALAQVAFSINYRKYSCLGNGAAHSGLGLPISMIKSDLYRRAHIEMTLQLRLSSQEILGCQVDS